MNAVALFAILALAVIAAGIYILGRGERGEAYSPYWPFEDQAMPTSTPAEEGAPVPGEEREAPPEVRRAA